MSTAPHIYAAFLAAQKAMGKLLKNANNPHFKTKYADLTAVQDACFDALHDNGFAVFYRNVREDGADFVETVLAHESGAEICDRVRLIVSKNDMQGYGSAVTYARRYGLMNLAGIAPEDDDGNAAAKNPPKDKPLVESGTISEPQFLQLRKLIGQSGADETKFLAFLGVERLEETPAAKFMGAVSALNQKIQANGHA